LQPYIAARQEFSLLLLLLFLLFLLFLFFRFFSSSLLSSSR
jgi:flagellar biogenesis protein FliO